MAELGIMGEKAIHSITTPKAALRFVLCAFVVFAALLGLWPVVGPIYGRAFCAVGNGVTVEESSLRVRYEQANDGHGDHDAQLIVNRPGEVGVRTYISSRGHGYLPTALLFALVIATPLPLKSRLQVAWWG